MDRVLLLFLLLTIGGFYSTNAQLKDTIINTSDFAEISPKISFDGSKIIYTSNRAGSFQFYECRKASDSTSVNWKTPTLISFVGGPFTGIKLQDPTYNLNGNRIYFSANFEDTYGGMDIYYSDRIGDSWSTPKNAGNKINSPIDETAPALSADENYCFFVRKYPPNKKGDEIHKIHYARKNNTGDWNDPLQLTATINSADENYPFFAADSKTLYFASKQHKEPAGYNIFMSEMYAENIWSTPRQIAQINNDLDLTSPSISANSNILYYTKSTIKRKNLIADIHSTKLDPGFLPNNIFVLKGTVRDSLNKTPLASEIKVSRANNMKPLLTYKTAEENGQYYLYINQGADVMLEIEKANYSKTQYKFNADYSINIPSEPIIKDFSLFSTCTLTLIVYDQEFLTPLQGEISVRDEEGFALSTDGIDFTQPGKASIKLPIGRKYNINVSIPNYEEYFFDFDLTGSIQFNAFELEAALIPLTTPFWVSITDSETNNTIEEIEITIANLNKKESMVEKIKNNQDGNFMVYLRTDDQYEIDISKTKNYSYFNTKVNIKGTEDIKLKVKLQPIKDTTLFVLDKVSFETNSDELITSSFIELERLTKLLAENQNIRLNISAKPDSASTPVFNHTLVNRRETVIHDYLLQNKISPDRFAPFPITTVDSIAPSDTITTIDSINIKPVIRYMEIKIINDEYENRANYNAN